MPGLNAASNSRLRRNQGLFSDTDIMSNLYLIVQFAALLSWVMHEEHYPPAVRWLQSMVEPVLSQIRRVIPPIAGIDLSVIAALLIIEMIRSLLLY